MYYISKVVLCIAGRAWHVMIYSLDVPIAGTLQNRIEASCKACSLLRYMTLPIHPCPAVYVLSDEPLSHMLLSYEFELRRM